MVANPTHGVRVKVPQTDPFITLEPDDFKQIVAKLPTDGAKLFAQFLIATGCRFGEATELRVKDLNFKSKEVYIRRTVCDIGKDANNGSRFLVVHTTKNNHKRTVVISTTLLKTLKAFIADKKLSNNDLLFGNNTIEVGKLIHTGSSSIRTNETFTVKGRVFNHATPYAYNVGKCRCDLCKQAIKDYRKQYRKDKSKGREILSQNTGSGHLSRTKWRTIWNEAIEKSGIGWYPKTHDLRHANATQLLKKGVDVHEVKERLGHQSITTTERYLHRIRHQQSKAGELADEYLLGER
jgi:integrase